MDADGAVQAPDVRSASTVAGEPLVACVKARISSWAFPPPRGGGTAIVTYRWRLEAGREEQP